MRRRRRVPDHWAIILHAVLRLWTLYFPMLLSTHIGFWHLGGGADNLLLTLEYKLRTHRPLSYLVTTIPNTQWRCITMEMKLSPLREAYLYFSTLLLPSYFFQNQTSISPSSSSVNNLEDSNTSIPPTTISYQQLH
jgi:hypothetical protein